MNTIQQVGDQSSAELHTSAEPDMLNPLQERLLQAVTLHQAGDLDAAARLYQDILQTHPAQPNANHNLGVITLQAHEADASLVYFRAALEADPNEEQYWVSYIDALIAAEQKDQAREVLTIAIEGGLQGAEVDTLSRRLALDETPAVSHPPAEINPLASPQKTKSKKAHKLSPAKNKNSQPGNAEKNTLANLFNQGRTAEARQMALDMTTRYAEHGFAWKVLGTLYQQEGLLDKAISALETAIKFMPQDAEAHYNLGNIYFDQKQLIPAQTQFKQAIKANPNFAKAHYNLGSVLKSLGNIKDAEARYKTALKLDPKNTMMHFNLALILQEQEQFAEAMKHYKLAIKLKPDFASAHVNLGITYKAMGQLAEAEASYKSALCFEPAHQEALINLGVLLNESGRGAEAEACYQTLLAINPEDAIAYHHRGNILREMGKAAEAEACYMKSLSIGSSLAKETLNNLGVALAEQGKFAAAEICYQKALEKDRDYADAYVNLGLALCNLVKLPEAEAAFEKALQLNPTQVSVMSNFSTLLNALGQLSRAEALLKKALAIDPEYANAHINLGLCYSLQGRLQEAEACYLHALKIQPDNISAKNNLLFTMNYTASHSVEYRLEQARQYGHMVAQKAHAYTAWQCDSQAKRLRVGIVSGDLHGHAVAFFLENLLRHIDTSQIELIAYPAYCRNDQVTARLKPFFSDWKSLAGLNDQAAAQLIHDDGVHILLDLSGHSASNRLPLFAWRPAPVQVSWLGYFATTGVAAMDYFIADEIGVPVASQSQFIETIKYLPDTRLCFTAPDAAIEVSALPALTNGYITFGCFQNMAKVGDDVLALWAEIMQALPDSKLRWQCKPFADAVAIEDLTQRMANLGISADRLILLGLVNRDAYLAAHTEVDMILDSFPFPGGTTTCEALWMGVPTLTLAGDTLIARQGASLLSAAGLADWIVDNPADFVSKALSFCQDLNGLSRLRVNLRTQVLASPLFDGQRFARNMEKALWEMWEEKQKDFDCPSVLKEESSQPDQPSTHQQNQVANTAANTASSEKTQDLQQALDEVLQHAIEQQNAGQIEEAEQLYQEIIRIQPDHAEANHNLGVIVAHTKDTLSALPKLETAVMSAPENEQFWVSYIDALMQSEGAESAVKALELGQKYGLKSETVQMLAAEFAEALEAEVSVQAPAGSDQNYKNKFGGFNKLGKNSGANFLIVAPYYTNKSAGIVVLHELCDSLSKLGHNAAMILTGSGQFTISSDASYYGPGLQWYQLRDKNEFNDFIRDGIVIYPEVITGNPLGGKRVVRYVLNREGFVAKNKMEAAEDDFILTFSKLYHDKPHASLIKLPFNAAFNSENSVASLDRAFDLTYIGKGRSYNECYVIPNTLEINRQWPSTKAELALLFKNTRYFYSWDVCSQTNSEAILCGAIPVFLNPAPLASFEILDQSELGRVPRAICTVNNDVVNVNIPDAFAENLKSYQQNYMDIVTSYESRLLEVIEQILQYFAVSIPTHSEALA